MTQQKQLEAILEEALLVWKQDYPKSDGDNGLLMDEYFERLEKAKLKATQAITALIQEARIEENVRLRRRYNGTNYEKLRATLNYRIEQLSGGSNNE